MGFFGIAAGVLQGIWEGLSISMGDILFYQNYEVSGDIISMIMCIVSIFLLGASYVVRRKNLQIFKFANALVFIASLSSIIFHQLLLDLTVEKVFWVYVFRSMTYIGLIWTYACFCIYTRNLVGMKEKYVRCTRYSLTGVAVIFAIWIILTPITKRGFYIDEQLHVHQNYYTDPFRFAYVYYTINIITILVVYRKKFIGKIFRRICYVAMTSYLLTAYQDKYMQTTYLCVSFTFIIITILFLYHHNSYDTETGTLDHHAFEAYVRDMQNKSFSMIFLNMPDMTHKGWKSISTDLFQINDRVLGYSCTFRLRDNKMVLVYQKEKNKNVDEMLEKLYECFVEMNKKTQSDFKIVLIDATDEMLYGEDYLELCEYVEKRMQLNTIKVCEKEDMNHFLYERCILQELHDIYIKDDLNDARVKAFCQPVLNTGSNAFTTAEALMRLELPGLGVIMPDQFIPLAEKHDYIHVFSKIILNKTCQHIKELEAEGYQIERVSINFSIQELHLECFCEDLVRIIEDNGVAFHKIAVELTESRNEKDFNMVKAIMEKLQELGIKFYLDDFGTGYSNFARIIGLPIDIIKFDRSLTILAGKNDESRFMVGSFSEIFKKADYQILFEGVEDEKDEMQCIDMKAMYLQGYKYSKPIPMEQLKEFLCKRD